MRTLASLLLVALALGLDACGGSGGRGDTGANAEPPAAAPSGLSVTAGPTKTLEIRWNPVPGATGYRLFEDVDGEAGPGAEELLGEPQAGQQAFTLQNVFLPGRVLARYRLQACNPNGCAESARVGIDGIDGGIGVFRASRPGAGDEFGEGLALSPDGRFMAVGAYREDGLNTGIDSVPALGTADADADVGAVYVFRRDAEGWVPDAYIKPAVALSPAWFGRRLALAGSADGGYTLLVGSPADGSGGASVGADPAATPPLEASGAAYVFERDALGQWAQTHYIKAPLPSAQARFGSAVGVSGDRQWIAIGQPEAAGGGSVALYRRSADGWSLVHELHGRQTAADDLFGRALQFDPLGRHLVVGAPGEDHWRTAGGVDDGTNQTGAAYVFGRGADDQWSELLHLQPPEEMPGGSFGYAVAVSEGADTLVVGEPLYIAGETSATGRVHTYRRDGAGWRAEQVFLSPLPLPEGSFGDKLALSADGSTLAVANPWENATAEGLAGSPDLDSPSPQSGAVHLYRRGQGGTWTSPVYIKAPSSLPELYFGWSLGLSATGDALAVYGRDSSAGHRAGAVYLY